MEHFDTVIRNGKIVDGTGAAPFCADVGIRDGKIVAVGRIGSTNASEIIDARGMVVAPGHISQHTHYDAMIFWNPYCSNSGENGVTTVVNANCGFGFAPVRPSDRERTMLMMETTEQIPVSQQRAALPWNWETFSEYLDAVRSLPKGVNVMSYLPVNPLLIYVMGVDAAKTRLPTDSELAVLHRIINEAMDDGAMGISMSCMGAEGNTHVDFDGSPMPTDVMDTEVAMMLAEALRQRGEGVIQILSQIGEYGDRSITERLARLVKDSGVRIVHNSFLTSNALDMADGDIAWINGLRAQGLDVTAQTFCGRGWQEGGIKDLDVTTGQLPAVREIVSARTDAEVLALISDPDFQKRFQAEYEVMGIITDGSGLEAQTVIEIGDDEELQPFIGRTLGDISSERGEPVSKTYFDLAIASKFAIQIKSASFGATNPSQALRLMSNSAVTIGISDGGAHTKAHALGSYGTDFLIWLVREQKLMTLEEMHYQLALKAAQQMRISDRGAILPGFWADLLIYDLEQLYFDRTRMDIVYDMPEGDWRRKTRAGGYNRILVNGVTTHIDDATTGAMPGVVLQVTTRLERLPLAAE